MSNPEQPEVTVAANQFIDMLQKVLDPEQPEARDAMLYALNFRNDVLSEVLVKLQAVYQNPISYTSPYDKVLPGISSAMQIVESMIVAV